MVSMKKISVIYREFLKNITLVATVFTALIAAPQIMAEQLNQLKKTSEKLSLNAAGYDFQRLDALFNGDVKIKGCEVKFQKMAIGDMNTNVFHGPQSLDITEIGLHPFMLAYANDDFRDYTLLTILPLRLYRHKSIFIRNDRGITTAKDLIGKTLATPGYSSTSLTWIRGILPDEYSVSPQDVKWVTSAKD